MNIWETLEVVCQSVDNSSTQNEPYEMCRARGDFPIVHQSRMVSLNGSPRLSLCVGNTVACIKSSLGKICLIASNR